MTDQAPQNITVAILRVKELFFSLNETLYVPDPAKIIKIELSHNLQLSDDNTRLNFVLTVFIFYVDSPPEHKLAEITVQNLFLVNGLVADSDGSILLPNELLVSIVNMSISHIRALFADRLGGSVYQQIILPITNSVEVAKHFFKVDNSEKSHFIIKQD